MASPIETEELARMGVAVDPVVPGQGPQDPWAPPPLDSPPPAPGYGYGYGQPQWAPPAGYGQPPPSNGYGTSADCFGSPAVGASVAFGLPPVPVSEQLPLASPGRRLVARLLDVVVGFAIFVAVFFLTGVVGAISYGSSFTMSDSVLAQGFIAVAAIAIAYEIGSTATRGQTLGKLAVGIKVVRSGGTRVGWGRSLARWGLPVGLAFVPVIGWIPLLLCYLAICRDGQRRGWHDRVAKTFVVRSR